MKNETKRTKQMMIYPSVLKKAEKLQKERGGISFSSLVEVLINEAAKGKQ